jgi:hypothetical protein
VARRTVGAARHAEVEQLGKDRHPVAHEKNVLGLHVAVHHAGRVHGGQAVERLHHQAQERGHTQRLAHHQPLRERHTVEQLHHQVGRPTIGAKIADVNDVPVANAGGDLSFALEALHGALGGGTACIEQLDGHLLHQRFVLGAPHGPHAPDAQRMNEAVLSADEISRLGHAPTCPEIRVRAPRNPHFAAAGQEAASGCAPRVTWPSQ